MVQEADTGRLNLYQEEDTFENIKTEDFVREEYTNNNARVIAYVMSRMTNKLTQNNQFMHYSLIKGTKNFGEKATEAAFKEIKQLHNRTVFEPVKSAELTDQERRGAMESLIFLVEKRDKTVKARTCANGSTQREYICRENAASPTASTASILITSVIDAKQG